MWLEPGLDIEHVRESVGAFVICFGIRNPLEELCNDKREVHVNPLQ